MKKYIIFIIACLFSVQAFAQVCFDKYFEEKTLRIDYVQSGNSQTQTAVIYELREEPVWGGPKKNLIDNLGRGGYYFKVYDKKSGELIYSKGYCTLFEEWLTTEEAKRETQAWLNSIVMPYPKDKVIVEFNARDRKTMEFSTMLRQEIDPESIFIDRRKLVENPVVKLLDNGGSADKVDMVFLAEGYTADQQDKFVEDARKFMDAMLATAPFDSRRDDFNVWAVGTISQEAGTSSCGTGVYRNTALGTGYYTFGTDRYLTTPDIKDIRDAVWNVPCDAIFLVINAETFGGGGMYNVYACGTADNEQTYGVFMHEFGHSFAGLADEYFGKPVAYDDTFYNLEKEPWEPNITTLVEFEKKWKDLLPEGTQIPTPLNDETKDKIGVFEGGGYVDKGIYRPVDHCKMRDYVDYCPACSRAILQVIDHLSDK